MITNKTSIDTILYNNYHQDIFEVNNNGIFKIPKPLFHFISANFLIAFNITPMVTCWTNFILQSTCFYAKKKQLQLLCKEKNVSEKWSSLSDKIMLKLFNMLSKIYL